MHPSMFSPKICGVQNPVGMPSNPCLNLTVRYQTILPPPPPKAASSPIVQQPKEAKLKTKKAVLNHPLRILIMNCQSIKNKKAEIHAVIDSAKPDIILGNESWLTPEIKNSEIFPDSFDAMVVFSLLLGVICSVQKLRNWTPIVKSFRVS